VRAAALAVLVLAAGCHRPRAEITPADVASADAVAPADSVALSPGPAPHDASVDKDNAMNPLRRSSAQWASSGRSSRVAVAMRPHYELRVAARLAKSDGGARPATRYLLPLDGRVFAASDTELAAFSLADGRELHTSASFAGPGSVGPAAVLRGLLEWGLDGAATGRYLDDTGFLKDDRVWVEALIGGTAWVLAQEARPPTESSRPPPTPTFLVALYRLSPDAQAAHLWAGADIEGALAGGALFERGGAAIATTDGRLVLVDWPKGEGEAAEMPKTTHALPFKPYEIAVAGDRIALLEAVDVAPGSGLEGPYASHTELAFRRNPYEKLHWSTRLHVVDREGKELDQATVPFPVLQPPIDGEGGRFYLSGQGFAAVGGGYKVAYWNQSKTPSLATAMLGGDVALALGGELRLVARDGTVRQSLHVAEGETILTPPAVAEDGSLFVATEKAIYVAK
jgi:hypothetical protein